MRSLTARRGTPCAWFAQSQFMGRAGIEPVTMAGFGAQTLSNRLG